MILALARYLRTESATEGSSAPSEARLREDVGDDENASSG